RSLPRGGSFERFLPRGGSFERFSPLKPLKTATSRRVSLTVSTSSWISHGLAASSALGWGRDRGVGVGGRVEWRLVGRVLVTRRRRAPPGPCWVAAVRWRGVFPPWVGFWPPPHEGKRLGIRLPPPKKGRPRGGKG